MQDNVNLVIFTKAPVSGTVKTRLQPDYTTEQSLKLHKYLVKETLANLVGLANIKVSLFCAPNIDHEFFLQCKTEFKVDLYQQQGRDLGEKMYNALSQQLKKYHKVIIIGTDCPGIGQQYINQAIEKLEDTRLVIGPAEDGGYVLVAMKQDCHDIFSGISWGSEKVLQQTRDKIQKAGVSYSELETKHDIDDPGDLERYPELQEMLRKR